MNIIKGRTTLPARRVIYGPSGVGKTKFACSEPGALGLEYEDGIGYLGFPRVEGPKDWMSSLSLLREACTGPGDHKAVVVDTIDRLQDQAAAYLCTVEGVDGKKKKSLGDFAYGAGYEALETKWREMLFILEGARAHGRSVTLVAHVERANVSDPTMGDYSKYVAAIHKRCWSVTHRWADAVLFAAYESGLSEGRAILSGARLLHTVAGSGFDAKHRPNIKSPIPLSWEAYAAEVASAQRTEAEVLASIDKLTTPETAEKVKDYIAKANGDVLRLVAIETALLKKVTA